ncbi:MAG: hypothetical protein PVJ19_13055, partial [Desulfobacteraceae bacterium]
NKSNIYAIMHYCSRLVVCISKTYHTNSGACDFNHQGTMGSSATITDQGTPTNTEVNSPSTKANEPICRIIFITFPFANVGLDIADDTIGRGITVFFGVQLFYICPFVIPSVSGVASMARAA